MSLDAVDYFTDKDDHLIRAFAGFLQHRHSSGSDGEVQSDFIPFFVIPQI
jgi:hypothetical protein